MEPLVKEKRWDIYQGPDATLLEEEQKRGAFEREVEHRAKLVNHRHKRSSSRASDSSNKAGQEIARIKEDLKENEQIQSSYTQAVDAIEQAALTQNHGKELTGEGIDRVR